jgi:hypothetical protein
MTHIDRRLRALESATGMSEGDNSFCAQAARAHARGETIPLVIVHPGETEEEVLEREGVSDERPCIVVQFVKPGAPD